MTDYGLTAPPVVQVWYEFGTPTADDVSDEALPAGQGDEGNQFVFTEGGKWQFNLKTSNYTAPGRVVKKLIRIEISTSYH